MTTALTVTGVGIASGTLATAGTMSASIVTPPGFTNAHVLVGVATGWDEIWYNGNASAWAAGGAIGAPTGHGFLYDVTSLEGQRILAGNWTPALRFGGLTAGTLTGTLVTRAYKRSSGGVYTLIMSSTLAAQTFAPAFSNYAFPATAGSSTAFAAGDKLYVDIWLNITANATGSGAATLSLGDVSNTAGNGTINCAWVTPGYALSTLDVPARFGVRQAGGDPPLTIFGLHAASTTLPTAASTGTATSGVSSSFTTLIGTATGYGELWGLGNAGAWAAGGSLPAPDGHGWILDSTLLEGQLLQAGTFTMTHRLATSAAYTTFTATLYGRAFKYNGGTYTQIGPTMSVAANLTTTTTVYTLSATMPNTYFGIGDKLYFDTFLQITASTGGVGTTTVRVSNSSDATFGVANQAQLVTAGYLPGNAKDTPARFRLVKAVDAISRFRLQIGATPTSRDALARFRQQSGTTYHNAFSRFRLVKALDVLSRFRLQLGTSEYLSYKNTILADNPIRYYRLGETTGTTATDIGSQAQNGTLIGGAGITLNQASLQRSDADPCMSFNGTSGYITAPTTGLPTGASAWSVEAWVKMPSLSTATYSSFVSFGTYAAASKVSLVYQATLLNFRCDVFGNSVGGTTTPVAGKTYHVVATYDGTTVTLYVNGVAEGSNAIAMTVTAGFCTIGSGDVVPEDMYTGLVDEVAIYSAALSSTQVATHYNAGLATSKDALSRFRQQSGTSAASYIPRVFGGTIKIASSITSASRDALSRFRLLATTTANVASRLRLQSAQVLKDVRARFRLVKALDALSRYRLLAATSQSLSSRFRLNQPSALTMAWIYPGSPACNAPFEYADGRRIDVLKPQYYTLQSDGTLVQNTVALSGCNGYSAANATDIKKYSTQQFATISGLTPGMDALATDSTKTTNFINTLTTFLTSNGFTGVELDFEGFGLSSMSATQYADYKTLVTTLGNALHASGFKLMIDGPAIFNSTYQSLFRWHWEDFDTLPVDYLVVMCYDFQFDNGSGTAVAPLATITSTCTWMQSRITDPNRIVIGLNSYGYHGTTGAFSGITIDTQVQSQSLPGFGTATRDAGSGEMMWATGGVSYDYSDTTTLDGKRAAVYATGLRNISVWHLGGNQWFSNVMANTATRFRLQPAVLPHDMQSRLRLLATRSVDVLSRFRLQSVAQFKGAAARFRQQSAQQFKDVLSRFRLVITPLRDTLTRLRLQSPVQSKDTPSRFRQLATKSVNAVSRFRLQSVAQFKDTVTRFRLQSGTTSHDAIGRFRLLATKRLDAIGRFRLQSGTTSHDALSRFRQQSGVQTKDAIGRFRLLATKSADAVSRFRLQSGTTYRDVLTRFRLFAAQSKDALSRFRLLVAQTKDAIGRFRLQSGTASHDALSRFRLQSGTTSHDALSRFRLVITPLRDVLTRLRLQSGITYHDALTRFRLQQVGTRALDALSRFRVQSGTTLHDAIGRFRLVITPLRDALSRLRVQSGTVSKDALTRFRLQSGATYRDALARFRQLATTSKDTLARLRLLATRSVDIFSRFRLQSGAISKDVIGRFRQQSGTTYHDVVSRLRLVNGLDVSIRFRLVKTLDALARFRLLATKSVDTLSRFRLLSSIMLRDAIGRFRVQSGTTSHDVLSRFRQQSGVKTSDLPSRLRLLATTSRDALARLRLLASRRLDAIGRFRLGIPRALDALARFGQQSGTIVHDTPSRFRLQQVGARSLDILSRFRQQSATTYRDALTRFRLVITPLRDVVSRLRVQSVLQSKDAQGRFRQIAVRSLDIVSRLRVQSTQQLKDSLARYRLLATRNADQPARFRQQSTVQRKDSQSRYRQLATKSLDAIARLRLQSSAILKDARIRFLLLVITSVSVVARLRVQSVLVVRDTLARFRLQIGNPRVVGALSRFRIKSGTGGRDAQARFSLTTQALSSAGTLSIELTFRDGVAELTFRDGVAEETFR